MRIGLRTWLCCLALALPAAGENGYRNVVNRSWETVADGPVGGVVIDVASPSNPTERASRLRRPVTRAARRRQPPPWFKLLVDRRMLPADQPIPALPQTVVLRSGGRLVTPQLDDSRQAGTLGNDANRLRFVFARPPGDDEAVNWSAAQRENLSAFLADIEDELLRIYGPPAFANEVTVVHDPTLNDLNMAIYDASSNQIRIELLNDVDNSNPGLTPIDEYDQYVLTLAVLKAYRDDVAVAYDSWEDGMARAAQLLVISQARPDFGFLARDFNLLFSAYDVLNQPGLESPSYLGAEAGDEAQVMREGLGVIRAYLAQAAWLKVYAENPDVFRNFNDLYYDRYSRALSGNIPLLKDLVRRSAPQVEGLSFDDWYRRQHVLNTAVIPGAKVYIFNIPQKDFITGEPTNSLPMNIYHFQTTVANQQRPLGGTARFTYYAYDGFDLTGAVEGASGSAGTQAAIGQQGNAAGLGSVVPLFFNIAGDQQVQMQRIQVIGQLNGIEREIWFPNDVAADDNRVRNHLYGLVTNGFQGSLTINIEGKAPIETNVIQGAFKVKVPGGLPVPAKATFTWTPDSSGGSRETVGTRNVMFLGPIGSGVDVAQGDAVVILDTPPETMRRLTQAVPAGLRMITIPAFAIQKNEAEVLGVDPGQLLMARADGAVPRFESYRQGDIYRLWPNTPAFRPGYAYWVQAAGDLNLDFEGVEATRDRPFRQHYPPGWAQFGNPWSDLNITLGSLQVQGIGMPAPVSLAEAQTQGIVSSGVFRYSPSSGGYVLLEPNAVLTPYEGFWINILADGGATIIFPNSLSAGPARGRPQRAVDPRRWSVGLVAETDGHRDAATRFGISGGAGDSFTPQDVAKPPPFGPYLAATFPHHDWGRAAGSYAVDLREADGAEKTWDLLVESNLGAREVTLSWPDLAGVPDNVSLVLEDLTTGRRRLMRSTASYRFTLGPDGRRPFRIYARRATGAGLAVAGVELRQGRSGASLSYTLTAPAEVTAVLASQSGRLLRVLETGRASTRGVNEIPFRAIDAQGRPLPNGIYRIDLIAVDEDGRQVRTSRIVRVER